VDDFIIAAPSDAKVEVIVKGIQRFFSLKDLGEPSVFLGCTLDRDYDARTITMKQRAYV
jgi:hypothetical protein